MDTSSQLPPHPAFFPILRVRSFVPLSVSDRKRRSFPQMGMFFPSHMHQDTVAWVLSRSSTPQVREWVAAVVSFTNHPRHPKTGILGCIGSRMFFGCSSATFSVRRCLLMRARCSALELGDPKARLLQVSASLHGQRPALVDLPKCPIQARQPICVLGGGYHALAPDLHHIMQTVLVRPGSFWALSSLATEYKHGLLVTIIGPSNCFSVLFMWNWGFIFRWFKRRCNSLSFFSVVSTSVTFAGSGALTLGASAFSPPSLTNCFFPSFFARLDVFFACLDVPGLCLGVPSSARSQFSSRFPGIGLDKIFRQFWFFLCFVVFCFVEFVFLLLLFLCLFRYPWVDPKRRKMRKKEKIKTKRGKGTRKRKVVLLRHELLGVRVDQFSRNTLR